ncbi:MAG: DUF2585 family protein [bacterium]|nr:DUF2585 family protein [bacterium]
MQIDTPWYNRFSARGYTIVIFACIALFAFILYLMGQPPICDCGYVKLWHGVTFSSENSQHIADWYTFSHIIHGFVFYFILWAISRWRGWKLPFGLLLLIALLVEIGWELFENTDFIINRYREVTISLDYFGDSIINSVFDVGAMVLGFIMARKLPVVLIVLLLIAMELFVGYTIRDNLTLNVIMLVYPNDTVRMWQAGE